MKSLSNLALIAMLLFACKLCSFTGNDKKSTPTPAPTPVPQLYAADILKTKLGSFTLIKLRTRDEVLKSVNSEPAVRKLVERASDTSLGSYKSENGETVLFWVFSYPSPDLAESYFDDSEKDMRASRWHNVKITALPHGRRIEGTDSKSRAAVIWTNGYWFFWAWSNNAALTDSFVESVGY